MSSLNKKEFKKGFAGVLILALAVSTMSGCMKKNNLQSSEIDERVADLLKQMTMEDKIAQISNIPAVSIPLENIQDDDKIDTVFKGLCYGTMQESYRDIKVEDVARRVNALQDYFVNHTRLRIPVLMTSTSVHGLIADGATVFPQLIATGSTWNRKLIEKMAAAIAEESSAAGFVQDLGPNVDCAVDPRWGRFEECFGQDPFHVAEMGIAYITGMQGDIRHNGLQGNKIFTTIKHYTGYSKPVNGINIGPSSMSERELRSVHIYPYKRIIEALDQWSVMPSYNAVNNIPCHGSSFLLRDILRKELGFKGYTYTDWGAVEMLCNVHKVSETYKDAAIRALTSGVDLNAPRSGAYKNLKEAVENGEIDEKWIDEAVSNILRVKFKAGLFNDKRKIFDEDHFRKVMHCQKHIDIAREVAEEACILLTNKNQILPLDINKHKNIAVIGPNANQIQYGGYAYVHEITSGVTVLQGIRNYAGNKARIHYAKGCGLTDLSTAGFGEAVAAAKKSDVVIMVCGGSSRQFGGVGWIDKVPEFDASVTCGEGFDRAVLTIPGVQEDLIKEIQKTGKPVVLVLLNGRPYTISWMKENLDAILEAWYPGEQGGIAIANILFGKVNPSGKLPVDWPQTTGHIYTHYNYLPASRGYYHKPGTFEKPGRDYVEHSPDALFPFGHGLSYTRFEYSNLRIEEKVLNATDTIRVKIDIRNTGQVQGKEVVQLYVHDKISSVTTPVKALKGFEKIEIEPNEIKTVQLLIPCNELGLWDENMKYVVEPGSFDILVGSSSEDIRLQESITIREAAGKHRRLE